MVVASPLAEEIQVGYEPTPPQFAFHSSQAKVRGYGGAVGGGKSRAICEEALIKALLHPGLRVMIARQAHTSIVETTKTTMMEQVLPPRLIGRGGQAKKASGGEDWVELVNGSRINFVGLEDPIRWFSSELGLIIFDEAHEIPQETVLKLISRLRQRCQVCREAKRPDCAHMPNRMVIAFNPDNPGHWLQTWFITGAAQTRWGFYKKQLYAKGADEHARPLGDAEFIFANAEDNPYLPPDYIDTLKGYPEAMRKRYLEGLWVPIEGQCFFSVEALERYRKRLIPPKVSGYSVGWGDGDDRPRIKQGQGGPWAIFKTPVREHYDEQRDKLMPAHRYIAAVDVSSGGAHDYSGIQVVDVDTFEQVARYQGMIDPDLLAREAARIGYIYNEARVAPEITGGWGFSVVKELQRLKYRNIYTRKVQDRLTDRWTDKIGWDTTVKTRSLMLDTLERVLREEEFGLYDAVTHQELGYFMRDDAGRPAALREMNDDLVMALAIAVFVATTLPRFQKPLRQETYEPEFESTGY